MSIKLLVLHSLGHHHPGDGQGTWNIQNMLVRAPHKLVGAPDFFSGPSYISGPPDGTDHVQADWGPGTRQLDHPRSFFFPSLIYPHGCFNHLPFSSLAREEFLP